MAERKLNAMTELVISDEYPGVVKMYIPISSTGEMIIADTDLQDYVDAIKRKASIYVASPSDTNEQIVRTQLIIDRLENPIVDLSKDIMMSESEYQKILMSDYVLVNLSEEDTRTGFICGHVS